MTMKICFECPSVTPLLFMVLSRISLAPHLFSYWTISSTRQIFKSSSLFVWLNSFLLGSHTTSIFQDKIIRMSLSSDNKFSQFTFNLDEQYSRNNTNGMMDCLDCFWLLFFVQPMFWYWTHDRTSTRWYTWTTYMFYDEEKWLRTLPKSHEDVDVSKNTNRKYPNNSRLHTVDVKKMVNGISNNRILIRLLGWLISNNITIFGD